MVAAKKQQAQGVPLQLLQQSQPNTQGVVQNAWFQPKPQQPGQSSSSSSHGNNQHSPQLPARIVFQPPPLGTGFGEF